MKLNLTYGVITDDLSQQIKEQGFNISEDKSQLIDKLHKSINMVYMHSLLTDSEMSKVRGKFNKKVLKIVAESLKLED